MPINSVPVDQTAFTKLMVVTIEPRTDRETGIQLTNKDGSEKKWTVQTVAVMPNRWDPSRTDSEVIQVTVTSADDPAAFVGDGDRVVFDNLTVGVMAPEMAPEAGKARIRGGKLFWQATGVRSEVLTGGKS